MIKIIADTLACIPLSEAQDLGIYCLPQLVIFGEETFRDDTEMDAAMFLKRLRSSQVLPKTAAPPPILYAPIFQELAVNGDTGIVIVPSAQVSGTYRSAMTAAQDIKQEYPNVDIRIIDTNTISSGLGSIVRQALKWIEAGDSADAVVEKVNDMAKRERVYFLVDTLEYLFRGGRIGAAKALFGSLLQVKPILTIREGHTEAFESQRTQKRALARLVEIVLQDCPRDQQAAISIMQGDAEAVANNIAAELSKNLGISIASIPIVNLSPAILTHAGPGTIGVSYFVAPEKE